MHPLVEELRKRGWVVRESDKSLQLLPDTVAVRYPRIPLGIVDFLRQFEACQNAREDAWMLTPADFRKADPEGFRWNEFELMALEWAEDDLEKRAYIEAFWNNHLPIMMAVHSDYDYLAVRLTEPHLGAIVHGFAPDWENPLRIADSFEEFLMRFTEEAASSSPAYPYDLFL